jgi:NAD(P)-dependent dehydrogenase (short-subunit alcohol dehydrogenase family)
VNGRTALVTGASRGIGRAVAGCFRTCGARVLTPTRADLDLADERSVDRYLARLTEPIDILVNNAGVNWLAGVADLSDDVLAETMSVNLLSPLRLARAVAQGMAQRGWGRIVNITSVWTVVAKERRLPYVISKTGLNGLTRAMAVELGAQGVLVNAVAPGFVMTELTAQNNSPEEIAEITRMIPLRRMAEPSEIAELVAFLASSRNSFMTGQVLVCDGGYSSV